MMRFRWPAVFATSAIAWVGSLPLAAIAAGRGSPDGSAIGYLMAFVVYSVGSLVCHQRPDRSFHLFGVQLAVCARCTGIYVGGAAASVLALILPARVYAARSRMVRALVRLPLRPLLFVSVLPIAITLVYELAMGGGVGNWVRAASGVPLGAAIFWLVWVVGDRRAAPERGGRNVH